MFCAKKLKSKKNLEKSSALVSLRATGAMLYQLSYETTCFYQFPQGKDEKDVSFE